MKSTHIFKGFYTSVIALCLIGCADDISTYEEPIKDHETCSKELYLHKLNKVCSDDWFNQENSKEAIENKRNQEKQKKSRPPNEKTIPSVYEPFL